MNLYVALAIAGTLLASGAAADRFTPIIGANARINHFKTATAAETRRAEGWRENAAKWTAYGHAEKRAFDESERLRGAEGDRAVTRLNEAGRACSARVARARASAAAIERIVTKPVEFDKDRCPTRALMDEKELSDALRTR